MPARPLSLGNKYGAGKLEQQAGNGQVSANDPKHPIPHPIDLDALLNETEAAEFLKLSVRTLQAWRSRGSTLSVIHLGRAVRYRRRDLIEFIEANTVSPSSDGQRQ